MRVRGRLSWLLLLAMQALVARSARAADGALPGSAAPGQPALPPARSPVDERYRALAGPPQGYFHVLGSIGFGDGLRFNNPYRLRTQLGKTPESVSLTTPYTDIGASIAFGSPNRWQHGGTLHLSIALSGVAQQVITPGYFLVRRGPSRFMPYGRAGAAIITSPDPNIGGELAVGAGYFLTGGLGVFGELVGNLFYGAGTYEVRYAPYPIVSCTLGILTDFEVLP